MANLRAEVKEYCNIDVSNGNFFTMNDDRNDTGVIISLPEDYYHPEPSSYSFNMDNEQDSGSNDVSNLKESSMEQEEEDDEDSHSVPADVMDEKKGKDKFNVECLSYELQVGYRILSNMMSAGNRCINKLFLYPVDDTFPETADYYEKIKEPVWMFKMKEKFEKQEYRDVTEFMADFRLMIENCYRFNGPDHFVSKKAQKLETMMKQKVALLKKDLRDKIAGAAASAEDDMLASAGLRRRVRNPNVSHDDPSQQLLCQLRRDREMQERVDRRQKVEDRKAMEHARIQEMQTWEDNLLGPDVKDQIRTMWELPQIGLFVYLCMESLGLEEEVTQYQIERGLAVPRECSDFRRLMTCLLSTPHQRKSLKSFMPYHIWNSKLAQKLDHFYKVLSEKNGNQAQTCYFLGLDTRAFKIMGKRNPLLKKQFHQLSYLKRVWILKNFCDYCMETQPALQKTIDDAETQRPNDVREVLLGLDSRGNRYINFPMFTGKDIRIYKQAKHPEPSLESLSMEGWSLEPDKISATSSRCSTPVNRKNCRTAETPSTSLRARVLLQAAESVEASPARDISRSGSEAPDSNSSPAGGKALSAQTTDTPINGAKTKQTNSSRKRKHSSMFFSKRKRLKTNKKSEAENKSDPEKSDTAEGAKNETSGRLSAQNVKSNEGSSTSESASCDKLVDINSSELNSPDKSTGYLSADISREDIDTPAKHSTSSNNLSTVAASSSDTLTALKDSEGDIAQGSPQGCRNSSSRQQECSDADGVNCAENKTMDVIKPECNGSHDDSFPADGVMKAKHADGSSPENGADTVCKKTLSDSSIKMEMDLRPDSGEKMCGSVTPVKQEPSHIDEKGFSALQSKIKLEYGDKSGGQLSQGLIGDKNGEIKNGKFQQDSSGKLLKSEGHDGLAGDLQKDKDCLEVKTEPVHEEAGMETKIEEAEKEEDSDEEDLPDLGEIELVAENMEDIRELIKKLSNPDPVKKGRKVIPGVMKPCEEELVQEITRFHDELVKYERSLVNARIGMQAKLRKEVESYVEPKMEEAKAWESECSQSSSDESEEETVSKPETNKPPKKTKQKSTTTALLSSAASKLCSLTGEENGDSNDSFELDISSRGRLRKRRVIPNNTEDTGLKKRKNLPNQDAFFSVSPATVASTTTLVSNQVTLGGQRPMANQLPAAAASNSTIKAQLASHSSRAPGQIVRLIAPGGDAGLQNVHLENVSSQSLQNIRFISGGKSVSASRSMILASSAQTAHPVIQQLLLNQAKPAAGSVVTTKASNDASRILQRHLSGMFEGSKTSAVASSGKIPLDINVASANSLSPSKAPVFLAPNSAAVVVTQVSTSVSQGGKQVLDLGNLSVTQLEQLVKNQAIQINTSAGGTTTLMLTTGLQHLTAARASGGSVIQAAGVAGARTPVEAHNTGAPGMSSLLTMIKKPQMVVTSKPNSWLTIPTQIPAQTPRTFASTNPHQVARTNHQGMSSAQVPINQGLSSGALQTALARTVTLASPTPGTILMTPAQFASVAKTINSSTFLNSLNSTSTQKSILAPRIISSLASAGSHRFALGAGGSIVLQKPAPVSSFTANGSSSLTVSPETLKSRIITVPLVHLSPSKKYASNVTVKTLIQNRGSGRSGDEEGSLAAAGESQPCSAFGDFDPDSLFAGVSSESETVSDALVESLSETVQNQGEGSNRVSSTTLGAFQTHTFSGNELYSSSESGQCNTGMTNTSTAKLQQPFVMPLSRPLWVDTAAQSFTSAPVCHSEVIVPTVNIKVPSPNTLPSVQHNKNGTTIVQSTKVPIPVASEVRTGDSLSPSGGLAVESTYQGASFPAGQLVRRVQPAGSNLVLMSATNSGNALKLPAGLKNVTLKITPQGGSAGQYVQGFMTPQGLVIPQTALLQPHLQSGSVVLGSSVEARAVSQLNPVKIQPSSMLGINSQQNIVGQHGQTVNHQVQHTQQASQKVMTVANSSSTGNVQSGILSQSSNPGLKIMLVNTPTATVSSSTTSSTGSASVPAHQQQKSIAAPASELVKQIASSSQIQRNSSHQVNLNALSPGNSQQNAAYLLNSIIQGSVLKQTNNGSVPSGTSPASQTINTSATVSPQLTAQVVALQQNSQGSQQYKPNLVLAAKPVQQSPASSSQNKPPVISFQVQQLGQLISNLGGVSKIQMDRTLVQNPQMVSVQKQVPPTLGQSHQAVQPASRVPHSSQVVRVTGHLSPQLQLQNQGLTQIQPQGNVVIQQQALLPQQQQQSQSFIIQQPGLSQAVLGSNSVNFQLNAAQPQINAIQQQLSKTLQQQPATCLQSSVANKAHFTGSQILNQQLIGMSHNPGLVFSHLQTSAASTASGVGNQPQIQFVISPSSTSNTCLSGSNSVMSSPSMLQVSSSASTGNDSRIVQTESAITLSGMNTHSTSMSGIPHILSPPSSLSHAVIVGTSPVSGTTTSTANKLRTHMIIPSSAAGKFLISPLKMSPHNPHASAVNPIKYVSAVQTQNPSSVSGLTSSLPTSTGHLPSTSLAGGQGHVPVRPGVIYAGHQATVADKKEGKIAQILLSQPVVSMQSSNNPQSHVVVGNHFMPASVVKLQTGASSGVLSSLGTDQGAASHGSKTLLYKIGDQYYTSLQQLIPQAALTTSDGTSTASNQGVQLLVPPSFIEASDQILQQRNKSAAPPQTAFSASGSSSIGNSLSNTQHGIRLLPAGREGLATGVANQMAVPLNGIYQNKAQFSFSLSGPASLARSDGVLDSSVIVGSQSIGSFRPQRHGAAPYPQIQHVTNSDILSTTSPIDKVTSRRNTFSGGQDVDQKGALPHRHLSADDSAGTSDDQDEKEAALNLLTLANQPI